MLLPLLPPTAARRLLVMGGGGGRVCVVMLVKGVGIVGGGMGGWEGMCVVM